MQLALDTNTWDIFLDSTGNIARRDDSTKDRLGDLICQRVRHRLQTFQGECYLDRSVGVPYFSEVLKKNPDLRRVKALLVATINGVEGIKKIIDFSVSFSARTREYKVIFKAEADDGTIVEGSI